MNEYGKEYIECRLILIGDEKVGKKSFINRLLNIPSTSTIHDTEAENNYKKQILKIKKKYEKKKKQLEMLQEINDEMINLDIKNKMKDDKTRSTISNINSKSVSKVSEKQIKFRDNNDYIMQITSEELYFSNEYVRPPIPEHPSKLFNIHKNKICVKPFFILPAEKVSYDYVPTEENSENEIDNELNISFKGIKNDIKKIINNKTTIIEELPGYKISLYNIFVFIYDMSIFDSFENLIHYYDLIEANFNISESYNLIPCIIGNKRDQKILLYSEKQIIFNDFIKEHNLPFFEISTKPYFNFDNFFLDFLLKFLNKYHENLYNEYNFKLDFEKIITNKSTFSKSNREIVNQKDLYPGPNYDINIYSFNSSKELNESLNDNKFRFNKKIFYNKIGPKFHKSNSTKYINNGDILKIKGNSFLSQAKGGLLNKPIEGYSFGIVKGKLDLLKSRKQLFSERNESLKESLEDDLLLIKNLDKSRIRGEDYIEEATERRNKIFEMKKCERKKIIKKLSEIHSNNLDKIKKEQEKKKKKIILSQNNKSLSSPNLLTPNNTFIAIATEEKENNKKRFLEVVYPKNKNYLEGHKKILKKISKSKKEYITPAPNAYDIRNNYTERNKGPSLAGKRKEMILYRLDPSFPDLKDEFDLIVEKGSHNYPKDFKPRFTEMKKEEIKEPYPDKEIWKKWEENKLINEKKRRIKIFIQNIKQKKKLQLKKIEKIKEQREEIQKLKKEILITKGYENADGETRINYSLIEDSSPKYSIKGRHSSLFSINDKSDISNIFPGNTEIMELIKNSQLNRPIPDINVIKPKLPSIIFNKSKRFDDKKKVFEGSSDLFKEGIFGLKSQESFSNKQPYSYRDKRDAIYQKERKSPSPAEYKIISSFDIIAEKGKKISEIRDKIRAKENVKNQIITEGAKETKLYFREENKNE